jgi:hypothetical protein
MCSYPGDSSTFLSRTWTSIIHDFDSLRPYLIIRTSAVDLGSSPVASMDLSAMLQRFLQGSGIPCPAHFAESKLHFSRLIPLHQIDTDAFRSRALCWAATGAPHVEFEDHQRLEVTFVGPDDLGYEPSTELRGVMMRQGKISFRTCFRSARIPLSHLVDLCSRSYPAKDKGGSNIEPFTMQQAIDDWLLVEILNGIGDHTVA